MTTSTLTIYANQKAHASRTRTRRILSGDEEARIEEKISELFPDRLYEFVLAINTGLRKNELYSLQWTDIDVANRRLFVNGRSATRFVPLNEKAVMALQALGTETEGFVFATASGQRRVTQPGSWWDRVLKAAHVERADWHNLRQTFASRCVSGGVSCMTLCSILGHKSVYTTCHFYGSAEMAAPEVVDSRNGEPR